MELLVLSVARVADGRSIIGFGERAAGCPGLIRLVAPTPSGVLLRQHTQIGDTGCPRPLDLIQVEAPWADGRLAQPENRVVDHTPWQLLERPAARTWVAAFEGTASETGPLFGTPGRAIREPARPLVRSIACVDPEQVTGVCDWDERKEKYRTRLQFVADGHAYDLPLMDAHYSTVLRLRGEGRFALEQLRCRAPHGLRLIVSLGEPFQGWCYKSVAGILPRRIDTLRRHGISQRVSFPFRHASDHAVEHSRSFVAGA